MTYKTYRIVRPLIWIGMVAFCVLFWLCLAGVF